MTSPARWRWGRPANVRAPVDPRDAGNTERPDRTTRWRIRHGTLPFEVRGKPRRRGRALRGDRRDWRSDTVGARSGDPGAPSGRPDPGGGHVPRRNVEHL